MATNTNLFKIDYPQIFALWDTIGKLHAILGDTAGDSQTLSADITRSTTFTGQSKQELLAFSDLLNQYNGAFSGKTKGINPTMKYNDAVNTCVYNVDNFQYSNKLKGIE